MPDITTIGESLYWCYANLAMAHAAVKAQSPKYNQTHFIIRSRLYKGLMNQSMSIGTIADDERLKMILPQGCCYCGEQNQLSIDHLIPKSKGGSDEADNMVWACRSCNSAKGNTDILDWYNTRSEFPPLLLIRRYLKLAIKMCVEKDIMDIPLANAPELSFSVQSLPHNYPKPSELRLWVTAL